MKQTAKISLAIAATIAGIIGADAQSRSEAQGTLLNRDVVTIAELGELSQSSTIYGTARSMGLAGAITSLGADASSMVANPAGLAMSIKNEYSFTPTIEFGDGRLSMGINNLAAVMVMKPKSEGNVININLGVGYNKVADHNYNYGYSRTGAESSIAYLFSEQLTDAGIKLEDLQGDDYPNWNTLPTRLWGAALGYKGGFTDFTGTDEAPAWSPTWISSSALTNQALYVESRGSTGEYNVTAGANINNKLYIGGGMSLMRIDQEIDILYRESYSNNEMADSSSTKLIYGDFNQAIAQSATGFNMKIGATYRPIEALRIGVAYHSPTFYDMDRMYQAGVGTVTETDGTEETAIADSPIIEDSAKESWRFRTQSKLLAGVSYTFGQRALISFDYQCDWYGQIAMTSTPTGVDASLYDGIDQIYQSVNTFRLGGEFRVTPQIALRGGYGFSTSMLRKDVTASDLLGISTMDSMQYFTAGAGYAFTNNLAIDITYMNVSKKMSDYTAFYGKDAIAQSSTYSTKLNNSSIAISMILRM